MSPRRIAGPLMGLLLACCSMAQSGIRLQIYNAQWTRGADIKQSGTVLGIGFDHDLNPHLAFGVDLSFGSMGANEGFGGSTIHHWQATYRAYFLTGDHDRTSFYVGSRIGVRRISLEYTDVRSMAVPVGLRLGIRGGLPGFFADLYAEAGAQLGGRLPPGAVDARGGSMTGFEYRIGVDLGIGWD